MGLLGMALLDKMLKPDIDPYESPDPGKLIARSGRIAVRSERDLLLGTMGFKDTIAGEKDDSEVAASKKIRKKTRRNTLL